MTSQSGGPSDPGATAPAPAIKERVLVFIVAFLGLLILAGLAAVIVKIIYLSSAPPAQLAKQAAVGNAASVALAGDRLDLPAGAVVKSVSIGGDRLAVHYETPGGAGIAVVDIASGAVLRRLEVAPGGASR